MTSADFPPKKLILRAIILPPLPPSANQPLLASSPSNQLLEGAFVVVDCIFEHDFEPDLDDNDDDDIVQTAASASITTVALWARPPILNPPIPTSHATTDVDTINARTTLASDDDFHAPTMEGGVLRGGG